MLTVAAIVESLDRFAPRELAAEWDNTGLLLGERGAVVERLMTCLTVTPESAAEAILEKAELIVSHHPILFRGVKRLTDANPEGRMLLALARAGVAVYSPHTSFDNTAGGINDHLAGLLGLKEVQPLRQRMKCSGSSPASADKSRQFKVVVFVPDKDLQKVADALFAAGAGQIGQYRECSFRLAGTGTFFGTEAANPTVGQKGRREDVSEWRLEVVCPEANLAGVLTAMRKAHSYEEPAYDVYPLHPVSGSAAAGEGRVGQLPRPVTLGQLAQTIKTALSAGMVQLVGDSAHSVQRVALACGGGGELFQDAIRARAEVFLTGEMRFHDYLSAQAHGIGLVLPGHHATERCGVEALAERLRKEWPNLSVWASRKEKDPVSWV